MQKIPTIFKRDPNNMRHITRELREDCTWVLDGEGIATRKFDGTCVMFDGEKWWARHTVKPHRKTGELHFPSPFVVVEDDPFTRKTVGWALAETSPFREWLHEAVVNAEALHKVVDQDYWLVGTYELCGPQVNRNPEHFDRHVLIMHSHADQFENVPRDYDGLEEWLTEGEGKEYEGLVFHHEDGRMAKIKGRDFPKSTT
jgi:hypothetical protein